MDSMLGYMNQYHNETGNIATDGLNGLTPDFQSWYNSKSNASDLTSINSSNWLSKLEQMANDGDPAAIDRLFNIYATLKDQKTARDWTAWREDTQYQRLNEDLKKAGISPYILSGATPAASAAGYTSYSGSQFSSQASSNRSAETADKDRTGDMSKQLLSLLGTALIALAMMA